MQALIALSCAYCALCCAVSTWLAARWTARVLSLRALMVRADLAWASLALGRWWAERAQRRGDADGAAGARAWGATRAAWLLGSGCVGSWPVGEACRMYPRAQPRDGGVCVAPVHLIAPTRSQVRAFALCQVGVDDVQVARHEWMNVLTAMAALYLDEHGVETVRTVSAALRLPGVVVRRALRRLDRAHALRLRVRGPAATASLPSYANGGGRPPAILDPELAAPPSSRGPLTVRDVGGADVDDQAETHMMRRPPLISRTLASAGAPRATGRGGAS